MRGVGNSEIETVFFLLHRFASFAVEGTVAMASTGPGENGMQFYITLRDDVSYLNGKHSIFG